MKNSEMTPEQIEKRNALQRTEEYKIGKRIRDKKYRELNKDKLCKKCGINKRGKPSAQICEECKIKEFAEKGTKSRKRLSSEEALKRDKERRKLRKKLQSERNDLWINNYKKERCCAHCGYNAHPEILQFHHLRDKSFEVSTKKDKSLDTLKKEIEKCILLCPNCHFLKHSEERKTILR